MRHEITLIHTGDFHGHLVPRPDCRQGSNGARLGGLARVYAKISEIRSRSQHHLLLNTGDTIQGSAEVLYTRGQAIVDVVNDFGIDAFAPGNWDFVYGTERFLELFSGNDPLAPWNALACNLYYSALDEDPYSPYADRAGQRVLSPYVVRDIGGIRLALLGFTTDRGPQAIGQHATRGFRFTKGESEAKEFIEILREKEGADLIVALSELGLANNIRLAEAHPGIDIILSSDMHEEAKQPVVTTTGTLIVEEGQDGTVLGELRVGVENGRMTDWAWQSHVITEALAEDIHIARKIHSIRQTFTSGLHFMPHRNPFNGSVLRRPIDTIVGYTTTALHRSNFSTHDMPAVIEGSSHDFLADAFRSQCQADIGAIRGFRYGTHVQTGPITLEDLYHFIPIGPQIAVGTITGAQLKKQIENSAHGALSSNTAEWTGGWVFNFSGVKFALDPYQEKGKRAANITVNNQVLDLQAEYSYASYWYEHDADMINHISAQHIRVLQDENGETLDATEVVLRYLQSLPYTVVDPELHRIHLVAPLPVPCFGNAEIQPLRGCRR
jgi:S-sulfosulfanyl-L-cysteine sulfohydrolase